LISEATTADTVSAAGTALAEKAGRSVIALTMLATPSHFHFLFNIVQLLKLFLYDVHA
jgi:hypothetical protein